jgi:hypothetical protein
LYNLGKGSENKPSLGTLEALNHSKLHRGKQNRMKKPANISVHPYEEGCKRNLFTPKPINPEKNILPLSR